MRHAFGIPALTKSQFGKNQSYEVLTPNRRYMVFASVVFVSLTLINIVACNILLLFYSYSAVSKGKTDCIALKTSPDNEKVDSFFEYYRPYVLTNMMELYSFGMTHSIR